MRTCKTCPNYLTEQAKVRDRISRPLGVSVCGAYGHVLGVKGQAPADTDNMLESFASNCSSYGIVPNALTKLTNPQLRVAEVNGEAISLIPTRDAPILESCHGCENLIRQQAVYDQWGWPLPLCSVKGTLVLKADQEAKDCPWTNPGRPQTTTQGIVLRSEYRPGFVANPDKIFDALVKNGNLAMEPTTYETEREVTDADRAEGIRAWRRLLDPFGSGQEIFLPIFDSTESGIFTEQERILIPQTGSSRHPELYVDYSDLTWRFAVESLTLQNTLFVQSEPGLGKTEFVYYLGWLMQLPVTRLFFTDRIEWDDIFGKMLLRDNNMVWQDGRFTAPIRRPGLTLVDEPNMAPPEIVSTLRTTSEMERTLFLDAGIAEIDEDGNQNHLSLTIPIHPHRHIVWCGNPAWDPRNIGTKELAAADISRLSPAVLEYPPKAIERRIIKTICQSIDGWDISDKLLDEVLRISEDIREQSQNGEFPGTWGIRENVKVARKLRWYPMEEAYKMAVLNHFEPETREMVINGVIKTIHDETLDEKRKGSVT